MRRETLKHFFFDALFITLISGMIYYLLFIAI